MDFRLSASNENDCNTLNSSSNHMANMKNRTPDYRQMCKFGSNCYQTNPMHMEKFKHPEKKETSEATSTVVDNDHDDNTADVFDGNTDEDKAKKMKLSTTPSLDSMTSDDCKKSLMAKAFGGLEFPPDFYDFYQFCKHLSGRRNNSDRNSSTDENGTLTANRPPSKGTTENSSKNSVETAEVELRDVLVDSCGLKLVGPYDFLEGGLCHDMEDDNTLNTEDQCLSHYRYYYDPPEMITVLASSDESSYFHIGYFMDSPPVGMSHSGEDRHASTGSNSSGTGSTTTKTKALVVASQSSIASGKDEWKNCRLTILGDNIFGAVFTYISNQLDASKSSNPFQTVRLQKIKEKIHVYANMKLANKDYSLDVKPQSVRNREKTRVASLFHSVGLVVPYDKKTQVGYRSIPETYESLKKMFRDMNTSGDAESGENQKGMELMQELVTNVQFANDECDPGMGLELGLNALLFGSRHCVLTGGNADAEQKYSTNKRLDRFIKHLLTVGYELVDRPLLAKIAQSHLIHRNPNSLVFKINTNKKP